MISIVLGGLAAMVAVGAIYVIRHWPPRRPTPEPVRYAEFGTVTRFTVCVAEERTRTHTVRTDGSLRCWDCGVETPAGLPSPGA